MYRIESRTLLAPAGTYKNADDQVLRILEERIAMVDGVSISCNSSFHFHFWDIKIQDYVQFKSI
jgi:thymidylate synthase